MMRSICLLPPACEHRASCAHPLAIRAPCRAPQVMAKKLADYYKKKGILTTITADTSHEGYVLIQQALEDQFGLLSQAK